MKAREETGRQLEGTSVDLPMARCSGSWQDDQGMQQAPSSGSRSLNEQQQTQAPE